MLVWTGVIDMEMVNNGQIEPLIFADKFYVISEGEKKKRQIKFLPESTRRTEQPSIEIVRAYQGKVRLREK